MVDAGRMAIEGLMLYWESTDQCTPDRISRKDQQKQWWKELITLLIMEVLALFDGLPPLLLRYEAGRVMSARKQVTKQKGIVELL